jgi:hypothetical protein
MFLTQWLIQKVKRNPSIRLLEWHTLFVVVYVSVVFEWWLPSKNSIYTADVWDVVCYVIGGALFISFNARFRSIKEKRILNLPPEFGM